MLKVWNWAIWQIPTDRQMPVCHGNEPLVWLTCMSRLYDLPVWATCMSSLNKTAMRLHSLLGLACDEWKWPGKTSVGSRLRSNGKRMEKWSHCRAFNWMIQLYWVNTLLQIIYRQSNGPRSLSRSLNGGFTSIEPLRRYRSNARTLTRRIQKKFRVKVEDFASTFNFKRSAAIWAQKNFL